MRKKKPAFTSAPVHDFHRLLGELTVPVDVDRRSEERLPRTISLKVQPLDPDFQPDGPAFYAVTRDISKNGLGFINAESFSHDYVRLGMPEQTDATIIARVCHNLSIGCDQPLYLVGVQFVT